MKDDVISRQSVIEVLSRYPFEKVVNCISSIEELPSAEPEPKWIPVTEQTLPRHNSVVVVCGNKGTWDYGTYRGHTQSHIDLWNWKKNTIKEVRWWMYKEDALPTPWKGIDNETY